jgi:hypothetical protein
MAFVALPDKFRIVDGDILLVMKEGQVHQPVCVTKDALTLANAPRDVRQSPESLDVIEQIASVKYDRHEIAFDGRIWITADDIRRWHHITRH